MSGKANSKLKLLYLMDIFYYKTDEDNILSANELCDELENMHGIIAERKSIYTDIEVLQEYGMDIIFTRVPKRGYFLASRKYEIAEIRLLIDAVQAAGFITPKKTLQLIDKIKKESSIYQAQKLGHQVYVDNRVKCDNEEIYYNIDLLNNAIESNKQVRLVYVRHRIDNNMAPQKEEKILKVNPYALIWSNDHYYLVGNNPKYDNLMHLRIDRMKKVTRLEEKSRPYSEVSEFKNSFDVALYASRMFNMFSGEIKQVKLICDNTIAEEILDRFGDNANIRYYDENSFLMTATATMGQGLVSWIMQYGKSITIVEPQELKNLLLSKAEEIALKYR
ncbi:MAG: WYL domain-containing protein [Oscillospiraceae bacterium]